MIPLGDDNTLRKTTPFITYALIIINILFFLLELANGEPFIIKWSFIPSRFLENPVSNIPTIFTSMFMHAGWAHLIGNMLYLWIFGDNVEDNLGRPKYLIFYLLSGIAATFAQMAFNPTSSVPNVGASGAIAGVLGAYVYLFPKGKVNVLLGSILTQMPALIVIGFWFVLQFLSSLSSFSPQQGGEGGEGGVAYMAHVGGFVFGFLAAVVLTNFKPKSS